MGPGLERGGQESPCAAKIMKAAKRYKSVQCRTFPWSHSVLCNLTERLPPLPSTREAGGRGETAQWALSYCVRWTQSEYRTRPDTAKWANNTTDTSSICLQLTLTGYWDSLVTDNTNTGETDSEGPGSVRH